MKMNFNLLLIAFATLTTCAGYPVASADTVIPVQKASVKKTEEVQNFKNSDLKADIKPGEKADAKGEVKTAIAAKASSNKLVVSNGTLEFFAIGKPSMLKIHGESTKLSGTASQSANDLTADLEVPLDSFETGMKVRNDHLKEKVFETSKFDKAKLSITKLEIPAGKTGEIKDLPFTGKLNLHGVEKDISGTATVNVGEKSTSFTAETQVKMTDFQIPPPKFMGMTIQDQVKVTAKGEAKL